MWCTALKIPAFPRERFVLAEIMVKRMLSLSPKILGMKCALRMAMEAERAQ